MTHQSDRQSGPFVPMQWTSDGGLVGDLVLFNWLTGHTDSFNLNFLWNTLREKRCCKLDVEVPL